MRSMLELGGLDEPTWDSCGALGGGAGSKCRRELRDPNIIVQMAGETVVIPEGVFHRVTTTSGHAFLCGLTITTPRTLYRYLCSAVHQMIIWNDPEVAATATATVSP